MDSLKLTSIMLLLTPIIAFSEVDKYESTWGKNCNGAEDSYGIKLVNNSGSPVDYRVCLEHQTGDWTCFVSSNVLPGELGTSEWNHFICDATGESDWWWRDAGDYSVNFPNPRHNNDKDV